ncbi:MAG: GNAT family N-acetyltransferase [Rubrivivax sp.]
MIDAAGLKNPANTAVLNQVLKGESSGYAEGLAAGDLLFAHVDGAGTVDTFGFVIFASSYKRFLGIDFSTPMIGNCNTLPAARGRGLYPALLQGCCAELARRGYAEVVITCSPDNAPSIRGITKAGFSRLHHLVVWIALSRLVLGRRVRASS